MKKVTDEIEDKPKVTERTVDKKSPWMLLNKDLLPSKGKYYPNDIKIRKLNAQEIKDLTKIKRDVKATNATFNLILDNCITGIESDEILLNDKLWFIYYLRAITFNDFPHKVKFNCPVCGHHSTEDYTLNKLLVTYSENDLPKEIVLPNGDVIEPTWPTIGTEKAIKALKDNPQIIEVIDDEILTISSHIKCINGRKMSLFDLYTYFTGDESRGSGYDFAYFCHSLKPYLFGARPYFEVKCPCGEVLYKEIDLTDDFFLPNLTF